MQAFDSSNLGMQISNAVYNGFRDALQGRSGLGRPNGDTDWTEAVSALDLERADISITPALGPDRAVTVTPSFPGGQVNRTVSKGEFLVATAWGAGLTVRPVCLDRRCNRVLLRFVCSPAMALSSAPPGLDAIAKAAKLDKPGIDLHAYPEPPSLQLHQLLARLGPIWDDLRIHAPPQLLARWVSMHLVADQRIAFTQIIDRLCATLGAQWAWSGDDILIIESPDDHQGLSLSAP